MKSADTRRKTMKQSETKFQSTMMVLSFIYSGISLILFIVFLVVVIKGGNVLIFNRFITAKYPHIESITTQLIYLMSWVTMVLSFCSGIICLLCGIALHNHPKVHIEHKEEKKKESNEVDSDLLMPEEKKIVEILQNNDNSMTQTDLVKESGFTKVKIHRIVKRLEGKKILSKYSYGMTNRIKLERKLKDE